ncbi:MarR family winged helix-turn-helix transcriptional regulator [Pseudoalteromonas sp.]|uniref:MarR family winged helix-turn-helix transcriptional regulator n=1 Tax=Pseudoalteromonas sp. TaxID=53249 RepID=UPI00300178F6
MTQDNCSFLLADVTRLMRRNFTQQLTESPLTLAQAKALKYVARQQGVKQVELADKLEVQPITLARLIDQLEKLNLVERRADPSDRRAYLIYLTNHADEHITAIDAVGKHVIAAAMSGLTNEQSAQFIASLQTIRNTLLAEK